MPKLLAKLLGLILVSVPLLMVFTIEVAVAEDVPVEISEPSNEGLPEDDTFASEEWCSDIENDASLGPVRNQGRTELSSAFTAADILSHRLGQKISAVDIAIAYKVVFGDTHTSFGKKTWNVLNYGSATPVYTTSDPRALRRSLEAATARGVCDESLIRSERTPKTKWDLLELLDAIPKFQLKLEAKPEFGAKESELSRMARGIFPQLDISDFASSSGTVSERWLQLADKACEGKRISTSDLFAREVEASTASDQRPLFNKLDQLLDQGDVAGITFDHRFVYNQFYKVAKFAKPSHSALVVGRRVNPRTQACEYKIRSSWGSTCDTLRPDICFDGNLWIDRDELMGKLQSLTYLP